MLMTVSMSVAVLMAMFLPVIRLVDVHLFYSTSFMSETQPLRTAVLLGSMTTPARDFVDAPGHDCHYQKWQGTSGNEQSSTGAPGRSTGGDDQSYRQTEFLGRTRFHAHRRSHDVALWRKYALSGANCAGWHTVYSRLRDRTAHAGEPLGGRKKRGLGGNTYSGHPLPLGPHSGVALFCAALCGEESIPILQFPLEISWPRFPETGV